MNKNITRTLVPIVTILTTFIYNFMWGTRLPIGPVNEGYRMICSGIGFMLVAIAGLQIISATKD